MITSDVFEEQVDYNLLYFNNEIKVTDKITIYQPSVLDIVKNYPGGEKEFYFLLHLFVGNTTYFRVALWDNGIDWNEISDFEMFSSFISNLKPQQTNILFGDLDFSNFKPIITDDPQLDENGNLTDKKSFVLYDVINDIEINEIIYFRIRNYLRYMFNIFPNVQKGFTKKSVKSFYIECDRGDAQRNARLNKSSSFLFPLISSLCNHPGFKYRKDELDKVLIFEFMDSVQRIQLYEQATATLKGMMSGFVDGSKIKPDQYNFMREILLKPKDLQQQIRDVAENPSNIKYTERK